jgi:hypothetical protein
MEETTDKADGFKSYTAAELDAATFQTEYLVEGILAEGQPAILAGPMRRPRIDGFLAGCFYAAKAGAFSASYMSGER